jgi:hypothetical protein
MGFRNKGRNDMNTRTSQTLASAVLALAIAACTPSAWANLLVDPGYEANPLDTAFNVLNDFTTYQGIWGVEAATITGVDGGVTPAQGLYMLSMVDDGQAGTTQGMQVTDVTSYAALIDSGGATVNMSALFDANQNLPAALGGVYVSFFTANYYGSYTGDIGNTLTLDNATSTWESISVSGAIPAGTRWLLSQVVYSDASLLGPDGVSYPSYVDAAQLTIVPEPATLGLMGLGALVALRRRRRA